jgi:uncharacterized protein YdhG (YjbR/CyaY superfamily)
MKAKKTGFTSVDDYAASLPPESQKILNEIRAAIKAQAPDATEKISYQMPAFELNGKSLIHFAAWKKHFSIYPIPEGDADFTEQVSKYVDGKGTFKFPLDEPIPMKLINQIIKLHLAENSKQLKNKEN